MNNPGDSRGANGRYGVMCIEGYSDKAGSHDRYERAAARYGFDFYVIDADAMGKVIAKFTGRGTTLEGQRVNSARQRALKLASELNKTDSAHAA